MMQRVFVPLGGEGFELCHPVDTADFETINSLISGERRAATWVAMRMRLVRRDEGAVLEQSDCPWLGAHALILRQRAVESVGDVLTAHGELLPLDCNGVPLWVFNATVVLDALDPSTSSVMRFKSGRVMDVTKYGFKAEVIRDVDVFKIPDLRVSPTFVGERFVHMWHEAGLVGLDFNEVWNG